MSFALILQVAAKTALLVALCVVFLMAPILFFIWALPSLVILGVLLGFGSVICFLGFLENAL